jgi:hypothetical protein
MELFKWYNFDTNIYFFIKNLNGTNISVSDFFFSVFFSLEMRTTKKVRINLE